MRLYLLSHVEAVEATDEFRTAVKQSGPRREASKKGVETKRAKTRDWLAALTILVEELEWEDLVSCAADHYNTGPKGNDDNWIDASSPPEVLHRHMVNYLRHQMTDYEELLRQKSGRVGSDEAYLELNRKIYDAISEMYPKLADECERQMSRKEEADMDYYRRR